MATVIVSEYTRIGGDEDGHLVQVTHEPPLAEQSVAYTTAASPASNFNTDTKIVCIIADAKAHLEFGASPTATATSKWIPADTTRCYAVIGGQTVSIYDGTT